jgi:hypothetical protein
MSSQNPGGIPRKSGTLPLCRYVTPRPFPDVIKRAGTWRGPLACILDLMLEMAKIACYKYRAWI